MITMTSEALKKALRMIMAEENNFDYLRKVFPNTRSMSDDEVLDWAVNRLYSDELMKEMNRRLTYVPVCNMEAQGQNTVNLGAEYEHACPDEGISMPRVWSKKMVRVGGEEMCGFGTHGAFVTAVGEVCYIDDDGTVVCVDEWHNWIRFPYDKDLDVCPQVIYRVLAGSDDEVTMSLGAVKDFLPPEFVGFWDV